jgi:FkbM family methyltransferase
MKILLIVKQKKNLDTFRGALGCLLDRGHSISLAVQERDERRDLEFDHAGLSVVRCPSTRTDEWSGVASLLRSLRDCAHYLRPQLRDAVKLQTRTVLKLRQELQVAATHEDLASGLRSIPAPQVSRIETVLKLAERSLPRDPLYDELIGSQRPDLVLLSPVVHFGSAQADLVASARGLGIPVGMLLFSWDNLSTKGCLHRRPDWLFVWNEQQRREAHLLHGFPPERVVVVGAPRFDPFFALQSQISREGFHRPLGLDPSKPTLLYVCSSRFVSDGELAFIGRWLNDVRRSSSALLRECNVLVRPHPDVDLLGPGEPFEKARWPELKSLKGDFARPFDDQGVVVLRTAFRSPQGLYESIWHSSAVVGLNTSAELEAGIAARPVFTIVANTPEVDGQHTTLHFHYLLKDHGGFVSVAANLEEHCAQLDAALREPPDGEPIRAFIGQFLRPHGIDKPVAPLLADAIERTLTRPVTAVPQADVPGRAEADAAEHNDDASAPTLEQVTENVVRLARHGIRLDVHATPEISRVMRKDVFAFEEETVEWLTHDVGIGDVVYDLGAGVGVYTLIAAKHRGATVVAFESGYAAFGRLCDNLLLNACDGRVIPIPLELSDEDGLKELKYERWRAGQDRHRLREDDWHVRGTFGEHPYVQPVLVTRLDAAVERHGLPRANHLRLARSVTAPKALAGGIATLTMTALKSIFLTTAAQDADAAVAQLSAIGWAVEARSHSQEDTWHLRFRRHPVGATQRAGTSAARS